MTSLPGSVHSPSTDRPHSASSQYKRGLWMSDGNVILRCENLECRVHRGVLSMHSPVFERLLAEHEANLVPDIETLESSAPNSAVSPGPSVLVLDLPDKAEDILNLLNALYFRRHFQPGKPYTLLTLSSLLRSSTKYAVSRLRNDVISHLEILFPSTLDAYLSDDRKALTPADYHPILALNMAEENDVKSIMPVACYECCLLKIEELFDGFVLPTASANSEGESQGKNAEVKEEIRVELSPSARRKCLKGRDMLLRLYHTMADVSLWGKREGFGRISCKDELSCVGAVAELAYEAHAGRYWDPSHNILKKGAMSAQGETVFLCERCQWHMEQAEEKGKNLLWNELPKLYGIEKWESVGQ